MEARTVAWIRANPILVGAIVAGLAVRVVFWAWTGRIFEDALITVKHAQNLVDGVGLTHHLGEGGPVHGFTSALSVLVPIPGEAIGSGGGILVLRLASLAAFVAAAVYAHAIARRLELGLWPTVLVLGYLALNQNQIFFGMAGMETQIATAVLLAGVYYVLVEDYFKAGVLLGLAPLARPDFVAWIGIAYLFLFFRNRDRALRAALVSAAILAPWLIFTTIYYGSPVPNTIIAKSMAFPPGFPGLTDIVGWLEYYGDFVSLAGDWVASLAPFIERGWVVATPFPKLLLQLVAWALFLLAAYGSVIGWRQVMLRPAILFVAAWILYRLVFLKVGYFEWYAVPVMAVVALLAGVGLQGLASHARRWSAFAAVVIGTAYAIPIAYSFPLEARVQADVEYPVRDQLGRYLDRVIEPGQTWTAEPSGYLGFYTNEQLLDYPGLTSTTVTESLNEDDEQLEQTYGAPYFVARFEPDWVVMRPYEWTVVESVFPEVAARYRLVRRFESELDADIYQGGYGIHNLDTEFLVFRRNP